MTNEDFDHKLAQVPPGAKPASISQVPKHISAPNYPVILERLIRDVSVPMDRLREAQEFIERQQNNERRIAWMVALAQAQQAMEPIARDLRNESTKSKYASQAALDRAIRPHYTKYGLAPTFNTRPSPKGELWITVVGELVHTGGYSKDDYTIDMLADGAGPKGAPVMTRTHAIGSAVTYGKRQLLKMMFNLAEAGDDDDGQAAGSIGNLLGAELDIIKAALDDAGCDAEDIQRFLRTMKISALVELKRTQIAEAMQKIANHKAQKAKDAAKNP
jgi:hypothetical protein